MAEKIALYPGSFDPIHWGHIDVARRAAALFDVVVVAAYEAPRKNVLFSIGERLAMIEEALVDVPNVRVTSYNANGDVCGGDRREHHCAEACGLSAISSMRCSCAQLSQFLSPILRSSTS